MLLCIWVASGNFFWAIAEAPLVQYSFGCEFFHVACALFRKEPSIYAYLFQDYVAITQCNIIHSCLLPRSANCPASMGCSRQWHSRDDWLGVGAIQCIKRMRSMGGYQVHQGLRLLRWLPTLCVGSQMNVCKTPWLEVHGVILVYMKVGDCGSRTSSSNAWFTELLHWLHESSLTAAFSWSCSVAESCTMIAAHRMKPQLGLTWGSKHPWSFTLHGMNREMTWRCFTQRP